MSEREKDERESKRQVRRVRRVVVQLYRKTESGRVLPAGSAVTEYEEGRRGGALEGSRGR